jgi:hypothetical protein
MKILGLFGLDAGERTKDLESRRELIRRVALYPVTTREITDRAALASGVAGLRAELLRLPPAPGDETISQRLAYYEARLATLDVSPFVEALGAKPSGKHIQVTVTRRVNPEIVRQLAAIEGLSADRDVESYLAEKKVTRGFSMFVESKLPVVFHVGYAYTRVRDIEFDRLPDVLDPATSILGRKSESQGANSSAAFVSYPISLGTLLNQERLGYKWLGDLGFSPTFGARLDGDAGGAPRTWYFGGSMSFARRFFLTAGTSLAERTQLRAGAAEGMPLQPGTALPLQTSRGLKLFFGVSVKPY